MKLRQSWTQWIAAGVMVGAMALGALVLAPQTTFAQTDGDSDAEPTEQNAPWGRGSKMFGMKGFDMGEMRGEYQTYLAEALDITVEDLQAAQQKAQEAMTDAAVEAGAITQEQADLMKARHAFMQYASGQTQQSIEDALNAAVEAGAITQEQANLLLEQQGQMGRGMFGGDFRSRGGRGDFNHRDMMPGFDDQRPGRGGRMMPGYQAPAATPEANS